MFSLFRSFAVVKEHLSLSHLANMLQVRKCSCGWMDPVEGKVYLTHRFHDTPPMNTCGLSQERIQKYCKIQTSAFRCGPMCSAVGGRLTWLFGPQITKYVPTPELEVCCLVCSGCAKASPTFAHWNGRKNPNETRTGRAENRSFWITSKW